MSIETRLHAVEEYLKILQTQIQQGGGGGGGSVSGTSIPTANAFAKFDPAKHMNSEDMTDAEITNFIDGIPVGSSLLDFFYPIGAYFETSDASFDPNTAWGGTWVQETEQVRTASWTATSTNANSAKVTNSLMLPAGTYIGWIKIPVCSQETALAFTTNLGYETGGMFAKGQEVVSFTFTLSAETEIYAQTNMSHTTNYTYTERGYLKVVRISSHIGSRWHRTA